MGLIKNTDARHVVKHGFQDMGDLRKQAERVLQDARAEAQRIVDEARGRAESLLAESEPRGYAEGKQRGLGEGREEGRRLGLRRERVWRMAAERQHGGLWHRCQRSEDRGLRKKLSGP